MTNTYIITMNTSDEIIRLAILAMVNNATIVNKSETSISINCAMETMGKIHEAYFGRV